MAPQDELSGCARRDFLKASGAVPVIALSAHAAGSDVIRAGLIGCGGRGTEAAGQAMYADKGVRLVAMADMLLERVHQKREALKAKYPEQVAVADDHCFAGFGAYKDVIAACDVVLIANAAKFHPMQMMAAIEEGRHVFVEKPHAIDPAGVRVVREACELAKKKGLSVLSGLVGRFNPMYAETIRRVHEGAIGEIVAIEENFLRAPYVLYPRKPGLSEVEWQASNQYHFHWLSGDDVPQSLVHNLDRASWALRGQVPVKCHGMGGRSTLRGEIYGSVFDHHAIVYEYPGGVRLYAFCRTIPNCYNETSSILLGTKGRCNVTRGRIEGETNWQFSGPRTYSSPLANPFQIEQIEFFKAIRSGKPMDSSGYMANSTLAGVMGQISCYTGQEVTWDQAVSSAFYFPPRPEEVGSTTEAPVKPDDAGVYPVYVPGVTKLI